MLIKDLKDCKEFLAGDKTVLRELLHPDHPESVHSMTLALRYSLAHATVKPGCKSTPHKLKTSEVYYILEGEGIMHIDNETSKVKSGQAVYIPPNSKQFIENTGKNDLKFLCLVDPAWKKEDEIVL